MNRARRRYRRRLIIATISFVLLVTLYWLVLTRRVVIVGVAAYRVELSVLLLMLLNLVLLYALVFNREQTQARNTIPTPEPQPRNWLAFIPFGERRARIEDIPPDDDPPPDDPDPPRDISRARQRMHRTDRKFDHIDSGVDELQRRARRRVDRNESGDIPGGGQ